MKKLYTCSIERYLPRRLSFSEIEITSLNITCTTSVDNVRNGYEGRMECRMCGSYCVLYGYL